MAVFHFWGRPEPTPSGFQRDRHLRQQRARLGGECSAAESELLQILLQGSVGLLSAREVAGREVLAHLAQVLEQGILGA